MVDETNEEGDAGADPARVEALATRLREAGEPFVRATVVRREPPVSANVGDRAVVTADGRIEGWIGGAACAQSVVERESEAALADGRPRLIGLAPDPDDVDRPGLEAYPMTCHSGGTLEVFLDPVVPAPSLVVVGASPVARALARLAGETAFEVTVAVPEGESVAPDVPTVDATDPAAVADATDAPYVVAASMGAADAEGVVAGLAASARYVGLVASDSRAAEVIDDAAGRADVPAGAVRDAVTVPAGVDVGAETPEEIAVSILAELVTARRGDDGAVPDDLAASAVDALGAAGGGDPAAPGGDDGADAVDPVCGMDVDPDAAAATVEHAGTRYHFCSAGCAEAFADEPEGYL